MSNILFKKSMREKIILLKHINKFYDYYRRDKRTNEVTVYRKNNS